MAKVYINGEYKGNVDLDESDLRLFEEWSKLPQNKIQDMSNLGHKPKEGEQVKSKKNKGR